ncbi:MAG: methyltransferase domain-containing protein [Alphaproteobacteria bacterium]|nr:methyltransferase domain-containing protein [Alphaproteobacteria bacterium]
MAESLETEEKSYKERRDLLLKDIEYAVIHKAWFTLSHLLLDEGARVVDMGCDDGALTYAMAAMMPKLEFIGLDKSARHINKAKEQYKLPNLDFKIGDASSNIFEEESIDAIINSYILHEVFSGSRYNERIVSDTLQNHFKALKKGGVIFIRDFTRPPPEEFVLMEMPDTPSKGSDLAQLSEVDLLLWYAERARPRQDAGCGGFFLEELPERFPRTRLFRLPYKWAYEFIMRKDDRRSWETELPMEYTFFTAQEFRKELRALGARVQYSCLYHDEDFIKEKFEGRMRLYENDGTPIGYPPSCFIAVAYKMAERKSLHIEERRPSSGNSGSLKITAMRNQNTGDIVDVVSRDIDINEILPYHIDEDGRLKIYLHDGIARSIANAVPRGGENIDERRWSGHMIEPLCIDKMIMGDMKELDMKNTVLFCRDHLGLKPRNGALLEKGPSYYPAPDYIDEYISTYYLSVEKPRGTFHPKSPIGVEKFQAKGVIREMDAQQVLNAITVGMIPNARLELQILSLFQHLNIKAENWTARHLDLKASEIHKKADIKHILNALKEDDLRFKSTKGTSGQLRAVHSTFVEEGQSRGAISGLSAENVDFIVHDGKTVNTAVVLPLTKGLKDDVHAGVITNYLPVPQRHEGNGMTVSVPSFNIPHEITNIKFLKKFIADQFGVSPDKVLKLGESYYSHVGVTPSRIFPFVVTSPAEKLKLPEAKFLPFYHLMILRSVVAKEPHFMTVIARAYRYFHEDLRMDAKLNVKAIVRQRFEGLQPDWSIPLHYDNLEALRKKKPVPLPVKPEPKPAPPEKLKKPEGLPKLDGLSKVKKPESRKTKPAIIPFHGTLPPEHEQPPVPEAEIKTESLPPAAAPPEDAGPVIDKKQGKVPDYSGEELTDTEDYEAELESFLDFIEQEEQPEPRPEKW